MRAFFLTALILFFGAETATAATVRALSLRGLAAHSDAVVLGRALEVETHADARGNIVRSVRFEVDEYVLGAGDAQIVIRLQGGMLNGIGRKVPGEIDLIPNERTLLFLERIGTMKDGPYVVVGMEQGRFRIVGNDITGESFAVRTLGALSLIGENHDDSFGLGQADTCTFILLETFVSAIRALSLK